MTRSSTHPRFTILSRSVALTLLVGGTAGSIGCQDSSERSAAGPRRPTGTQRERSRKDGWASGFMKPRLKEDWTILCMEFSNSEHRRHCEAFAASLRNTREVDGDLVACVHDDLHNRSQLTYGRYVRNVDSTTNQLSTPDNLVKDMNIIQDLGAQEQRAFPHMRMMRRGEAYRGPPGWALVNSSTGQFTLQVAVFYPERGFNQPQRAAVDMVRELRSEGIEAYYHHGDGHKSIVTVGTFGPEVRDHMRLDADGRTRYPASVEALRRDARFKFNYENGRKRTRIVHGKKFPPYSFLVEIPRERQP